MPTTTMEITNENCANPASESTSTKTMSLRAEINSHLNLLQVARGHNDRRLVSRVLQHLPEIRRKLTSNYLINLISSVSGNLNDD